MCLGIPGQILEILDDPAGMTMGKVSFGGAVRDICLAYVPEARVGDYVLVHVGFALNRIDEKEAAEVFKLLEEMGVALEAGPAGDPPGGPGGGSPPA